ncbi:MAG: N-formylglutamate amidohydrolase [Limibaculum sp.]
MPDTPFALEPGDPSPVEMVDGHKRGSVVLTCEHGGRAVPRALGESAPPAPEMARHIAWDLGAEATARQIAARLGAPLVIQRYSRLVIDSNRPRHAPDLAPATSDGTGIPFNSAIGEAGLEARWQAIHAPFHRADARLLDDRAARPTALVAVHSFTPRLRGGAARPWHVGLLARADMALAEALAEALGHHVPDALVTFNEPYRIENDSDYTIPVHGEARGLPHVLVEIRNDLIREPGGAARWGMLLARSIAEALPRVLATTED